MFSFIRLKCLRIYFLKIITSTFIQTATCMLLYPVHFCYLKQRIIVIVFELRFYVISFCLPP